ncbi:MAG: NAD(P)/FAD-dependent oxidoreductase [Gammaproteobacteria bacterium]
MNGERFDPPTSIDYLIVGQGLAGSLLAWELHHRRCKIMIVDSGENCASRVAAGLINPVTGPRFVKTENIENLLPIAKDYYLRLSEYFQQTFYIEKPLLRLFRGEREREQCLKRAHHPEYRAFLGDIQPPERTGTGPLAIPFGGVEQKQTGYLLTRPLLAALKDFFIARNVYRQQFFTYHDLRFIPRLRWRNLYPRRIIFCEGHMAKANPWFSWLPMQAARGEILTMDHSLRLPDRILHFGYWIIPLDSHRARIGATFEHEHLEPGITDSGKSELIHACRQAVPAIDHARLIDHQAGIRPCTPDRQPFIGNHPLFEQLSIFNGFGAKGCVSIPGHCRQFADFLIQGRVLPRRCDIDRYHETHFTA